MTDERPTGRMNGRLHFPFIESLRHGGCPLLQTDWCGREPSLCRTLGERRLGQCTEPRPSVQSWLEGGDGHWELQYMEPHSLTGMETKVLNLLAWYQKRGLQGSGTSNMFLLLPSKLTGWKCHVNFCRSGTTGGWRQLLWGVRCPCLLGLQKGKWLGVIVSPFTIPVVQNQLGVPQRGMAVMCLGSWKNMPSNQRVSSDTQQSSHPVFPSGGYPSWLNLKLRSFANKIFFMVKLLWDFSLSF